MLFSPRFRQGMKAAIPIWIAFVPSSIAWGIAAQAHGLRLEEIILMSVWVYSGPAQFAVLEPLASGQSGLQILVAALLVNLRFMPMSAALAPYFGGVRRMKLLLSCQFVSASSFVVPYLQFKSERAHDSVETMGPERDGEYNLHFFLGVGMTSFLVWVLGSGAGYGLAVGVSREFEEALKFILPSYFAALLVIEMRGWVTPLICLLSIIAAVPGSSAYPDWGWIATAAIAAAFGWSLEQWTKRESGSF